MWISFLTTIYLVFLRDERCAFRTRVQVGHLSAPDAANVVGMPRLVHSHRYAYVSECYNKLHMRFVRWTSLQLIASHVLAFIMLIPAAASAESAVVSTQVVAALSPGYMESTYNAWEYVLTNPNVQVRYGATAVDQATGASVCGTPVPVGTHITLRITPRADFGHHMERYRQFLGYTEWVLGGRSGGPCGTMQRKRQDHYFFLERMGHDQLLYSVRGRPAAEHYYQHRA